MPFIWRWPGRFKAGHVATQIVENIDAVPTLCALARLEAMPTADGCDLSTLLMGENREPHRLGVTEFAWSRSVYRGQYRMVYHPQAMFSQEYPDGFGLLYDLENDPWEMRNLYFDPAYAGLVNELRSELLDWLVTTTRPRTVLGMTPPVSEGGFPDRQIRVRNKAWAYPDGKLSPEALQKIAARGSRYYL